jgi:DNA polymerase-3 subunit epsilon
MDPNLPLEEVPFAVVDVETTGMDPVQGRITEIAMMKVQGGVLQDEFSTLINPLQTIPSSITRITGIDNVTVQDAPTAREVVPFITEFLGDAVFTAHNASFDWGFVWHTVARERAIHLSNPRLCTVRLSRKIFPGLPSRSLGALSRFLEIPIPQRHRASGDAYATALLLIKLLSYLHRQHGIKTLNDLLRFQEGIEEEKPVISTTDR